MHKHHIIPKHMGGTDDPSNLIEVDAQTHAYLHKILWKRHGMLEDYLAWRGLLGLIGKEEIVSQLSSRNAKRMARGNRGRKYYNNGIVAIRIHDDQEVPEGFVRGNLPMSEEQKAKLRKPKSEEAKANMRKPKKDSSKMGKYKRTNEVKNKQRIAAKKQFDEEGRKRMSQIMKSNRRKCKYCGMESNSSNVTRHEKLCMV